MWLDPVQERRRLNMVLLLFYCSDQLKSLRLRYVSLNDSVSLRHVSEKVNKAVSHHMRMTHVAVSDHSTCTSIDQISNETLPEMTDFFP